MATSMAEEEMDDSQTSGAQGVLADVLDELDRERSMRAELEAEVRKLKKKRLKHLQQQQQQEQKQQQQSTSTSRSKSPQKKEDNSNADDDNNDSAAQQQRQQLIATETERDGYKQLVDVLTADNDAVSAAMRQEKTLPLHIVRMLEVMPYDPRAVSSAIASDEVYEWQVYKSGQWQGLIRHFPPHFRKLPIVQPKHGSAIEEATSRKLFPELPPKQCVLTDAATTKIIKLDNGYSVPQGAGGTWQWVSGWRVDKRVHHDDSALLLPSSSSSSSISPKKTKVDCDEHGWSYAEEPQHFAMSPTELCWDDAAISGIRKLPKRPYRRRRWTRQRSLVGYPHASENAIHYLRLLSENKRLSIVITKLSDQLVETKTKLTEVEDNIVSATATSVAKVAELKKELKLRDQAILTLLNNTSNNSSNGEVVVHGVVATPKKRGGLLDTTDKMKSVAGGFASSWVSSATSSASFFRKTSDADKIIETLRKSSSEDVTTAEEEEEVESSLTKETSAAVDATLAESERKVSDASIPDVVAEEDDDDSAESSPEHYGGFAWRNIGRNPLLLATPSGRSLLSGFGGGGSKQEVVVVDQEKVSTTTTKGSKSDEDEKEEEGSGKKKKKNQTSDNSKKSSSSDTEEAALESKMSEESAT